MTKLSVLEDAKVKIEAYRYIHFVSWSDDVVQELINVIEKLVKELEEANMHLNAQEWEKEDWKDYE